MKVYIHSYRTLLPTFFAIIAMNVSAQNEELVRLEENVHFDFIDSLPKAFKQDDNFTTLNGKNDHNFNNQILSAHDTAFTLVDANEDKDVRQIKDNDTIFVYPGENYTIRAFNNPPGVSCVKFILDGRVIVENFPPYAVFGNTETDFHDSVLVHGHHTLIAIPYPQNNAMGPPGTPDTLFFFVKSLGDIISYTLVNADTDEDIGLINMDDTINIATLPTRNLNIRANSNAMAVGSVIFNLDGVIHKENTGPFAFFGDNNGNYRAGEIPLGEHFLTSTPFTRFNGTGSIGIPFMIRFVIIDTTMVLSVSNDPVKNGSSENLAQGTGIYPNPSQGNMTMNFIMDHKSEVYLQIIDIKGIEVSDRLKGYYGKGTHTLDIDGELMPAGMYFLRLYSLEKIIAQEKFSIVK